MTVPNYLKSDLEVADTLPDMLSGASDVTIHNLQDRIRRLVRFVATRDETIRQLERFVATRDETIRQLERFVATRDETIRQLEERLERLS